MANFFGVIKMANFFEVIKMTNFCIIKMANFFYQKGEFRSKVILKMANFSL